MPQRQLIDKARVLQLLANGMRPTDVARRLGITKSSVSRIVKEQTT
jgi:DNA-binding IclR family transcriptional regulator